MIVSGFSGSTRPRPRHRELVPREDGGGTAAAARQPCLGGGRVPALHLRGLGCLEDGRMGGWEDGMGFSKLKSHGKYEANHKTIAACGIFEAAEEPVENMKQIILLGATMSNGWIIGLAGKS